MRILMYVVLLASTLAAYLSSPAVGLAPGPVKFLPDLLAMAVAVYVAAEGARQGFRNVDTKYWMIFGAIALLLICGAVVNQEQPGPIVNGMRLYLRAIPFFFLPAVIRFSDKDLKSYLMLILAISLLQVPLAIYQRLTAVARGSATGDAVFGTLMISGILSIFLIGVLCVMAGFMLRGRIKKTTFLLCFVALVVPMSINETKVTFFLLPLAMLVTFLVAAKPGKRLSITFAALGIIAVAGTIFIPLYDYFNARAQDEGYPSIIEFLTKGDTFDRYVDKKARAGTDEEAGRLDGLLAPFRAFKTDVMKGTFGLGMGNTSQSSLGQQFTGTHASTYFLFSRTSSAAVFLFEFGYLVTALILLLHILMLRDALRVARSADGLTGALALGYTGAWIAVTLGLVYLTIHTFESISFVFWFFSGVLVARRRELVISMRRLRSGGLVAQSRRQSTPVQDFG
jgi:hypothetical protein